MPGPGGEANRDETDPISYDLLPPPYGGHNSGYYGLLITTSPLECRVTGPTAQSTAPRARANDLGLIF
jgi:hypothetical protein